MNETIKLFIVVGVGCIAASARWSIENELGYLPALNAGAICTFGRTLKLERDVAHADFGHALLTEETQLGSIQYDGCRVVAVRFDLYGMLEEHMERVAGTIREEFRAVFRQHNAQTLQIDLHIVV